VDSFLTKLARLIREERLLPARATLLVAVSGGLDSMALLTALVRLRDEFNWRLEVAHFNHQLRGRAAEADERFVRRACTKLAVPCHVGHWPIAEQAAAIKSGGIERAPPGTLFWGRPRPALPRAESSSRSTRTIRLNFSSCGSCAGPGVWDWVACARARGMARRSTRG